MSEIGRIIKQARDQARDERDRDSSCVGEHVPGICEQRERPRDHCTDELHEHNGQRDAEREDQPLPVLRRACRAAVCRGAETVIVRVAVA